MTYLIKTIALNVIRKTIRIPKTIDKDDDDGDDDEMLLVFSMDE